MRNELGLNAGPAGDHYLGTVDSVCLLMLLWGQFSFIQILFCPASIPDPDNKFVRLCGPFSLLQLFNCCCFTKGDMKQYINSCVWLCPKELQLQMEMVSQIWPTDLELLPLI